MSVGYKVGWRRWAIKLVVWLVLVGYSVGWMVVGLYNWLVPVGYLVRWLVGVSGL